MDATSQAIGACQSTAQRFNKKTKSSTRKVLVQRCLREYYATYKDSLVSYTHVAVCWCAHIVCNVSTSTCTARLASKLSNDYAMTFTCYVTIWGPAQCILSCCCGGAQGNSLLVLMCRHFKTLCLRAQTLRTQCWRWTCSHNVWVSTKDPYTCTACYTQHKVSRRYMYMHYNKH